MCVKNMSNHSIHCSSEGMSSGGILTVEPEPVIVEGSFTSNSSSAGASARLFFCCEMYGANRVSHAEADPVTSLVTYLYHSR